MKTFPIVLLLVISAELASAQDHGHLNIGAVGTAQDDPLKFIDPEIFESASGYAKSLTYTNSGPYAGYFQGNITLTVLAATPGHGGPTPEAPALGAWVFAELTSVKGPPGGVFAFWESGAATPTISVPSGGASTNTWRVSSGNGSPGTDPFGHIHGRRFTASMPGYYTVEFRALDLSTNGLNNAPIHAPSSTIKITFQAGANLFSVNPSGDETVVRFAAPSGRSWFLESTTNSPGPNSAWSDIAGPFEGDDHFRDATDASPLADRKFYRLRGIP